MKVSVHLCFDGECEIAFQTYRRVLGGKITTMLAYGDSPMADQVPLECRRRIVHATLEIEDQILAGVDALPGAYEAPQGFYVTLTIEELEKARVIFDLLGSAGQIRMPFQETFWSSGFGVVVDRFGVPWEINCAQAPSQA